MDHNEIGCHDPEAPIFYVNNCGFFGSAATMNICSKCHKDHVMKQEQERLVASSFNSIVNGRNSSSAKEQVLPSKAGVEVEPVEPKALSAQLSNTSVSSEGDEPKAQQGPNKCNACQKRVGLMGLGCKCGSIFCAVHHYSDKHDCPFDFQIAARSATAKANPVVKAEKMDKI